MQNSGAAYQQTGRKVVILIDETPYPHSTKAAT